MVRCAELNGRGAVSSSTTWNSSKPGSFSREKVHVNAVQHGKQQPSKVLKRVVWRLLVN